MSDTNGTQPPDHLAFEFLAVNGFIYRCHKATGEMWRLQPDPTDKKQQVWMKIEDASVTAH